MFDTLHNIVKKEAEEDIATSLSRIANALEAIALPHTYFTKEFQQMLEEKNSWEKQAKYYQSRRKEK